MKLVVGLGNPGPRYQRTRHNLGFAVVDDLADRWKIACREGRHQAETGGGEYAGTRVTLAKPMTYMNVSGTAVASLRRVHGLTAEDIIAVYDELDLPSGRIRIRRGGGPGGHNGVTSLIEVLGRDFARVRIGIGRPPAGMDPALYVLGRPTPEERSILSAAVARAADAVESLLREGLEHTMNVFNRADPAV